MTPESVSATTTIGAAAEAVFAVLADPTRHGAIDGTGWVCEAIDPEPIMAAGQVFRMSMFHPKHPDGSYQMHNLVLEFEQDRAIVWRPGYVTDAGTGELGFGGWTWRYDLTPCGPHACEVVHTYDWSAVGAGPRERIEFPPFPPGHLANSLTRLGGLAAGLVDRAHAQSTSSPTDDAPGGPVSDGIRLSSVAVNCPDATALAGFYADITGGKVTFSHPAWATMVGPGGRIDFQTVSDYRRPSWPTPGGSASVHLDFLVDDLAAAEERVLRAGATKFDEQPNAEHCLVFADPEGHPFCLTTVDEIG